MAAKHSQVAHQQHLVLPSAWHLVRAMQVSGSRDTSIRLWNRSATEAVAVLSAHTLPVTGLATIDHHNQICSGSRDCTIRLWDAATSANVAYAEASQNLVTFMSAVPAEPAVLQTGEDLSLRLWDTRVMQAVQMLPQHSNIPLCCDVSPDGEDVHGVVVPQHSPRTVANSCTHSIFHS